MSIIKILDPKLANMIAAGEVVDRPASVIKELVENSIDAKAITITIEVMDFGMKSIVVTDNGIGMDLSDAHLAFQRHATSKISKETDLTHLHTLGFRGEALAAISSVSKITLKTRQESSDGIYVIYHGGKLISEGVASLNTGTSIEVSDLFYNTPARFKYIKSEISERFAIIDIFDRLALANPKIAFKLYIDQKLVKETYGTGDFYQLIDMIYGKEVTKNMMFFKREVQKMEISGYLIRPEINRSRKKDISIFVNGRYIKNYAISQAIIDGYHSFLMVGKYPIACVHIQMDPSLVDVNVHPQKYEVKFINESILVYHIELFVKQTLSQSKELIPSQKIEIPKNESFTPQTLDFGSQIIEEPKESIKEVTQKIPDMEFVGIFSGTYLLFQNEDGLYMMDQHAAMERIRYEHYFKKLGEPKKTKKTLMIPYVTYLIKEDLETLKHHQEELETYGFSFDQKMHLTSLPVWLRDQEIDLALEQLVSMLQEKNRIDLSILRDALAKDISCKGSIRANQRINQAEIKYLYENLRQCNNPYTCPHGRPTVIKISHDEVEKMFKRIVS